MNLRFLHSQEDSHAIPKESKIQTEENPKQRKKALQVNIKCSIKYSRFASLILIVNKIIILSECCGKENVDMSSLQEKAFF